MNEEQVSNEESKPIAIKSKLKLLWLVLGMLLFLITFWIIFIYRSQSIKKSEVANSPNNDDIKYTLTEVMSHNTKDNCWLVIEDNVYDITKFVSKHPGGEIIVSACGTDATEKFNSRPGKGTAHSALARKTLSSLRLGSLSD